MQKLHYQMAGIDTRIQNIQSAVDQNKNAIEKLSGIGPSEAVFASSKDEQDRAT